MVDTGIFTQDAEGALQWKIEEFTSLGVDALHFSPDFFFAGGQWYLSIHRVSPERCRNGQRIKLLLHRCPNVGPLTLYVAYTFSVKERHGNRHGEKENRMEFEFFDRSPWIPIDLEEERMFDLAPGDILTVLCRLERIDPTREAAQLKEELRQETGELASIRRELAENQSEILRLQRLNEELNLKVTDLEANRDNAQKLLQTKSEDCDSLSSALLQKNKVLRDYKDLFHKKEACDVILRVQGREFPAHRTILMARSPIFTSTFQSVMKEKATSVVEIEDCDPSSFADFLCYLYCGALANLSPEIAFDLFTAADKYDVKELRSECLEFLKENLSIDTFCDTFTLALRHSEAELLHLATDFFTQNAPQIILTVKWQQFLNDNPTQSNELLIKLSVPNKKSNS